MKRLKEDDNPDVRRKAAYALGSIAANPEEVVGALGEALKGSNPEVSQEASEALVKIGAPAVPAFLAALKSNKPEIVILALNISEKSRPTPRTWCRC